MIAGGGWGVVLRLAAGMLLLQASIGALNDLVDAGIDGGRKPGKPIPRGAARPSDALLIAGAGLVVGLVLAGISGPGTLVVAIGGVGLGYLYDLRLSRTAWSWLPLAAALPLVPIYAWLGASGTLPAGLVGLVPLGLLGGLGLALANGLADLERDRSAGLETAAVRLRAAGAWRVHAAALGSVLGLAWWLAPRPGEAWLLRGWAAGMLLGSLAIIGGIGLAAAVRPGRRERGWELEALGVAVIGLAWVAGLAGR